MAAGAQGGASGRTNSEAIGVAGVCVSHIDRLVAWHVRPWIKSVETMCPTTYKYQMTSPWIKRLDKSCEGFQVIHLGRPFNDLASNLSMDQFGLLFTSRWVTRGV